MIDRQEADPQAFPSSRELRAMALRYLPEYDGLLEPRADALRFLDSLDAILRALSRPPAPCAECARNREKAEALDALDVLCQQHGDLVVYRNEMPDTGVGYGVARLIRNDEDALDVSPNEGEGTSLAAAALAARKEQGDGR